MFSMTDQMTSPFAFAIRIKLGADYVMVTSKKRSKREPGSGSMVEPAKGAWYLRATVPGNQ
jgi:hypothetical protein